MKTENKKVNRSKRNKISLPEMFTRNLALLIRQFALFGPFGYFAPGGEAQL